MAHRRDNQQATMRATSSHVQPSPRITCAQQRPISIATRRPAPPKHQRNDCAGQGQRVANGHASPRHARLALASELLHCQLTLNRSDHPISAQAKSQCRHQAARTTSGQIALYLTYDYQTVRNTLILQHLILTARDSQHSSHLRAAQSIELSLRSPKRYALLSLAYSLQLSTRRPAQVAHTITAHSPRSAHIVQLRSPHAKMKQIHSKLKSAYTSRISIGRSNSSHQCRSKLEPKAASAINLARTIGSTCVRADPPQLILSKLK
ncbi:hypothetical protein F511_31946 [Dorcoceras hygrometricum]|uniref:Uncharacterized protein n=1 Tax=Dorcoceras hygrometricum TaxID=472368 RepID=A0A2Z7D7Z7_9LAMI|nr:hypothetical protein F511_31946 [Dorcoceras hygrometricum]